MRKWQAIGTPDIDPLPDTDELELPMLFKFLQSCSAQETVLYKLLKITGIVRNLQMHAILIRDIQII